MIIYRTEKLEIYPDKAGGTLDIVSMIEGTQDLTLNEFALTEDKKGYEVTVKRRVELYPDTIK